jgi:hypothetical protein
MQVERSFFFQTSIYSCKESNMDKNHGCCFYNEEGYIGPPLKNSIFKLNMWKIFFN